MATNKKMSLLGIVLFAAVIAGAARHVQGTEQPASTNAVPNDMPGMDMSKTSSPASPSNTSAAPPSGYAQINVNQDVQQRIGMTTGMVEMTPLTMSIRAVGIVRPDET